MAAALQGAGIDLGEGHAAAGDLGLAVPLVAGPGEGMIGEGLDEPQALFAAELGEGAGAVDSGVREEGFGEAVRQVAAEEAEDGAASSRAGAGPRRRRRAPSTARGRAAAVRPPGGSARRDGRCRAPPGRCSRDG